VVNGSTYFYEVTAVNAVGEGGLSNERSATPTAPATVPGAPSLNSATGSNGAVSLSWSAPASNGGSAVTGYNVYRSTLSGGETFLTTLGNVSSWTDSGVANGTTYFYKVTALNAVGEGGLSNERSATPTAPASVPGAPTVSSASAGNGWVSVSWSAPADGGSAITGYRIYRATASGLETLYSSPVGTATSFTDTSVANGTTYFYKVTALNAVGEGVLSNERSATPTAPATVPGAPSLNSASAGNGNVTLAWSAPASDGGSAVTGYKVYRSIASGGQTFLATLGNVSSWTDWSVANGTTYFYKVTAVNAAGEGGLSSERSATPTAPASVPGAPMLNSATGANSTVSLSWSAPSSDGGSAVTGYRVYRSTASGLETLLTTVGTVTSWTDSTVVNGTTYYYKVSALNAVGESGLSNEVSAQPKALLPPPSAPGAFAKISPANGKTGVRRPPVLTWQASTGATSYQVCVSQTNGTCSNWTAVSGTQYSVPGLQSRVTYYWQVRAVNANGVTAADSGTWWRFKTK